MSDALWKDTWAHALMAGGRCQRPSADDGADDAVANKASSTSPWTHATAQLRIHAVPPAHVLDTDVTWTCHGADRGCDWLDGTSASATQEYRSHGTATIARAV